MRLLIATDAWAPQVNGVVRTLQEVIAELEAMGVAVAVIAPDRFRTLPCPSYPEIRLALCSPGAVARHIAAFNPDFIHIATEGPIGLMARRHCLKRGRPFTTSYHTRFPEYLAARLPVPLKAAYALQRRFHNAGRGMMVATASLVGDLSRRGFKRILPWSRGVDTKLFRPDRAVTIDLPRPIFLNVGRVAVEKNLDAFLQLDLPGCKIVVGDGPALPALRRRFPDVHFTGPKLGAELAGWYAAADVFVFPSRTDTFGNVMLEALACGTPIAAFPVTGPRDVIGPAGPGVLADDLRGAALRALDIPRETARAFAMDMSWSGCARQFLDNVLTAHADTLEKPLSDR